MEQWKERIIGFKCLNGGSVVYADVGGYYIGFEICGCARSAVHYSDHVSNVNFVIKMKVVGEKGNLGHFGGRLFFNMYFVGLCWVLGLLFRDNSATKVGTINVSVLKGCRAGVLGDNIIQKRVWRV